VGHRDRDRHNRPPQGELAVNDAIAVYAEFHRRSLEDRDAFWR
jgi:hypothetical protein